MLTRTRVVLAISVFSMHLASADAGYRAGYEINLREGEGHYQITTLSELSESQPITHNFGEHTVLITLVEVTATTYVIELTVSKPGALKVPVKLLGNSFEGAFQGILEFSAKAGGIEVDGAIAINQVR